MPGSAHGASRYSNHGCRCETCKAAHTAALRRRRMVRGVLPPPAGVVHGVSCYNNWGCRCDICTAGNTARRRAYTARLRAAQVTP